MTDFFVGIDNGKSGAIAIISRKGQYIDSHKYDTQESVFSFLKGYSKIKKKSLFGIEQAISIVGKKQSIQGTVVPFQVQGFYEGILTALGFNYELIHPKKWTEELAYSSDLKGVSVYSDRKQFFAKLAVDKFIDAPLVGSRGGLESGIADALLIADYLRRISK